MKKQSFILITSMQSLCQKIFNPNYSPLFANTIFKKL